MPDQPITLEDLARWRTGSTPQSANGNLYRAAAELLKQRDELAGVLIGYLPRWGGCRHNS